MKKIIAGIIALTAVICTFTGCGKETADEVEEVTTAEITTGDEEETTAADTTEDISDPDGKEVSTKMLYMSLSTLTMRWTIRKLLRCRCPMDL